MTRLSFLKTCALACAALALPLPKAESTIYWLEYRHSRSTTVMPFMLPAGGDLGKVKFDKVFYDHVKEYLSDAPLGERIEVTIREHGKTEKINACVHFSAKYRDHSGVIQVATKRVLQEASFRLAWA